LPEYVSLYVLRGIIVLQGDAHYQSYMRTPGMPKSKEWVLYDDNMMHHKQGWGEIMKECAAQWNKSKPTMIFYSKEKSL
jgi:hypothetical protein